MAAKGGLGRGFDSLFEENAVDVNSSVEIRLSEIEPNRDQPRKDFDEVALQALADSIKEHGLIQPLLVRPKVSGGYQLVAGERRWRACRLAGLDKVQVVIRELSDKKTMEIAMIENLQREDLNPIEEALGYKYLIDNFSLTQEEVSKSCGKSRSAVANAIRLLSLPEEILELVKSGELSAGHGRAILSIEDEETRAYAVEISKKGASVREIERLATKKKPATKAKEKVNNYFREIELAFKEENGRKLKISADKDEKKGTITLEFFSKKDLEEIIKRLSN